MGAAQRVKRIYRAVDVWAGAAQRVKRPIERWRESASAPAHLCDTPSTYCYTTQHLLLHDPAPIVTRPSTYCYTTQHLSFTRGGEGGRAGQSPSGGGRHQHQATCMFSWGGGGSWGAPRCTGTCWGVQAGAERHGSEGGGGAEAGGAHCLHFWAPGRETWPALVEWGRSAPSSLSSSASGRWEERTEGYTCVSTC